VAKRIAVDKARPGQILAEEITRQDGVLLAGRASEITEGLIRMLGRMNIDTVVIEEAERRTREDILGEWQAELERIGRAFRRAADSPELGALRKTLIFLSEQERDKALASLELSEPAEGGEGAAAAGEGAAARAAGAGATPGPGQTSGGGAGSAADPRPDARGKPGARRPKAAGKDR
jgi:hypothetical protein